VTWLEIEGSLEEAREKARLCLGLNAASVGNPVTVYIRHWVGRLAWKEKFDEEIKIIVRNYLHTNANSIFLWVSLACRSVMNMKTTKSKTTWRLHYFPLGLDPLYRRMIDQIHDSDDTYLYK
jgi:hypothetical protein